VLLCASKNDEVVEYALSRNLSPALIAEYQTQLPDKKLLQAKLHEFYLQNTPVTRDLRDWPPKAGKGMHDRRLSKLSEQSRCLFLQSFCLDEFCDTNFDIVAHRTNLIHRTSFRIGQRPVITAQTGNIGAFVVATHG
jgi:hypothetical protein